MSYPVTCFQSGNSLVCTIPKSIRLQLDLKPGDQLWCAASRDGAIILGSHPSAVDTIAAKSAPRRRR